MIIKDDKDMILSYLEDNSGLLNGQADMVYIPEDVEECSGLIASLYEKSVPMTFSGAGTGMTGGRIPTEGVILSNELLKRMELIENKDGVQLKTAPGMRLEEIKDFLNRKGYFFPVNPTEESATVGASASNNSSGSWTYMYGSMRDNITGMELITRSGIKVVMTKENPKFQGDTLFLKEFFFQTLERPLYQMPEVKNAAGYFSKKDMALMDMIIGSEGTLGFISTLTLRVLPLPAKVIECIIFFEKEADAVDFVIQVRSYKKKSNVLRPRALEFFNKDALLFLKEQHSHIPEKAGAAIIFEQEVFDLSLEDEMLEQLLFMADNSKALSDDTWMADTPERLENLRLFRHSLPSLVNEKFKRKEFFKLSTDSSVPNEHLSSLLTYYNAEIRRSGLPSVIFGHIGNNHFHVNLLAKEDELEKARALYKSFMEKAVSLGGTISAEHGIGKLKKKYLPILYGNQGIEEMKKVKRYFDPKNLFNKGNLIDL
ncbi:MAG: FAD-binding oxidoreductase [Candidatus Aureabacteria bacterium]|nr:FAD-binding oxidoreductase [Candidatus Auribacterota bacterium]